MNDKEIELVNNSIDDLLTMYFNKQNEIDEIIKDRKSIFDKVRNEFLTLKTFKRSLFIYNHEYADLLKHICGIKINKKKYKIFIVKWMSSIGGEDINDSIFNLSGNDFEICIKIIQNEIKRIRFEENYKEKLIIIREIIDMDDNLENLKI